MVLSRPPYVQYARTTNNLPAARQLVYHYQSLHNEQKTFSRSFSRSSSASNTLPTSRRLSLKVCKPSYVCQSQRPAMEWHEELDTLVIGN